MSPENGVVCTVIFGIFSIFATYLMMSASRPVHSVVLAGKKE